MRANEGIALIRFLAHDIKVFKSGWVVVHMVRSSMVEELVM